MSSTQRDYWINMVVGLAFGVFSVVMNFQGWENLIRSLCDGCFIPAVLLLGFGGLVQARNSGFFDLMTYSLSTVFQTHYPGASIGHARDEDFIAYRDRKAKERKPAKGALFAGLTYLGLAFVFLILFYVV